MEVIPHDAPVLVMWMDKDGNTKYHVNAKRSEIVWMCQNAISAAVEQDK